MWEELTGMLSEVVIFVICAQALQALVGQTAYEKYLRVFVGMLILYRLTTFATGFLMSMEETVLGWFGIGG